MPSLTRRHALAFLLAALCLMIGIGAEAAPLVTISKHQVNGSDVGTSSIYVREDATIKLSFTVDPNNSSSTDSDSDADTIDNDGTGATATTYILSGCSSDSKCGWKFWVGDESSSNSNNQSGSLSASGNTIAFSFTTADLQPTGLGSLVYDYEVGFVVNYEVKTQTYTWDTGSSSYKENAPTYAYESLTETVTIHVRMDPPTTVVLNGEAIPGDNSLIVSWDFSLFDTSEVKAADEPGLKLVFCVRKSDIQPDGDLDTEALAAEGTETELAEILADGDAEAPPADGDAEVTGEIEAELEAELEAEAESTLDGDADADPDLDADTSATLDGDLDTDLDRDLNVESDSDSTLTDNLTDPQADGCLGFDDSGDGASPHTIEGLQNNVVYEIRAKARDLAGNYSREWSAPIYGTPLEVHDFWETYKIAGGKEDGGFCFIATATYGSYSAHEVMLLRLFRDRILARLPFGRSAIDLYYRVSPPMADFIREHKALKTPVAALLYPLVGAMAFLFELGLAYQLLALASAALILAGFWLLVLRERKEVRA